MKVALVNYRWSATAGGVERYVYDLAHGLLARGHEVHVYCHRRDPDAPAALRFHDVPCLSFYSALRTWSFARNAAAALRRDRDAFDVVHGFGRTLEQDIYRCGGGCHRAYLEACEPAMAHPLGKLLTLLNPRHRVALGIEARIYRERRFRRLTCISHEVARQIEAYYGIPRADMTVIHNGIDISRFSPALREHRPAIRTELGLSDADFVVLYVGSGFERKGLAHAVRAVALLPAGHLVVVGNGRTARYQALAESLGIGARIHFLGARRDAHRCYGAADVLVFPTLFEPFGTVALEAMAAGVPIVTTRVAGCSEVIDDGVDSYVVADPTREADIADRLERLRDPVHRAAMGEAAARKARMYSMDRNIEITLGLYQEVCAAKAASR